MDAAQMELSRRRRLAEEAAQAAAEAERIAREFAAYRPLEAARLFHGIRGKVTERKNLDRYHDELAVLTGREAELFRLAEEAGAAAKAADAAMKKAEVAYREAVREVDKFKRHRSVWQAEERKRVENAEELETEETAGLMAGRKG
jgi:hypothetical protein